MRAQAFLTLEAREEDEHASPLAIGNGDNAIGDGGAGGGGGGGGGSDGGRGAVASELLAVTDVAQRSDASDSGPAPLPSPAVSLSDADFDALLRHHRGTLRGKFEQLRGVVPAGEATR